MLSLCRRGVVLMTLFQLASALCALRAGEVYKSIDADGHVVYSDRAPTSTAQKSVVRVDQPDPAEVARNAKEQAILSAEDAQRKKQQAIEDRKKAQKSQEEYNRQVQCDNARNRYYALKDARRIYERDADGNRVYDDDAVADAKREEARLAMVSACEA
jgi:uncharacterized protein DUF4124